MPISNSTSRLYIGTDDASSVVPVVKNCGLKPSGLPSEQYTSVLAAKAAPATSAAAAKPAMARRWKFMAVGRPEKVGLRRSEPES